MKWLSANMAGKYQRVIILAAGLLIMIGLIIGNKEKDTSQAVFFLAFMTTLIAILFWNMFDQKEENSKLLTASTPGVNRPDIISQTSLELNGQDEKLVPNPLDSDLDIPLL